ncbi:MAG: metal ABC transporter permease [Acidimicrobiia bacterium]
MTPVLAEVGYQSNWTEVLQAGFMRNAFVGGTLVAIASGLIGYFVVIRRDAFAAHALAHIGFPGATFAVLVGIPVTLGLALFTVSGGLAIGALGKRVSNREVSTGTILALATGLGVLFASLASENTNTITSVLFGNLLAISTGQIQIYTVFTLGLAGVLVVIARPLLFASVDPQVAEAKGVPIRMLGIIFMVLLALAITMAVQVVGTLLLFALVVTPAATALAITARPAAVLALGAGIGLAAVWIGLVVAVMFNLPPSFCIVTLAFFAWIVTIAITRDGRRRARVGAAHGSGGHAGGDHHHPEPTKLSV